METGSSLDRDSADKSTSLSEVSLTPANRPNQRLHLFEPQLALSGQATAKQAKVKRFLKESIYNRLPFEISATLFFLYRYVIQLGFLDGRRGLIYHVLQGFWYRFLVGAKLRELEHAVKCASSDEELRSEIARLTRQKLTSPS